LRIVLSVKKPALKNSAAGSPHALRQNHSGGSQTKKESIMLQARTPSRICRVIFVCHCYREEGNVIRIISARKASPHEAKQYD
jgi:uncharacterized DUF497 family protein